MTATALPATSGYAPVNGLGMYYEVHGAGDPLVLLHGAFSGIGTSFGELLPHLSRNRKVIAVEYQGHARTADIDRPLSYAAIAGDVVGLLEHLGIERADVLGYSAGGGVAIELAMRHPRSVRKVVLVSVTSTLEGCHPELMGGMDALTPEALAGSPFEEEYLHLAPRPEDFPVLVEKVKAMNLAWTGWSAADFAAIAAPAQIVIGDSDLARPEHAVEMFRLLGGGVFGDIHGLPACELAVVPGTTHVGITRRGEWLAPMVDSFLDR
ncbi:alpha/beta fold hydrolase [Actinokineospora guangxiensis]|uniref:Alpha/beta fold hydrolase n=1 Tax=Actinokineospora guangxiensis TaxID=1490288 RepID=A0ABW0EJX6_9PSEU